MTYIKEIISIFYFTYWVYYNSQPFSFLWLVLLFVGVYIFESILGSMLEKSADKLKTEAKGMIKIVNRLEEKINKLETQINGDKN